MPIPQNKSIVIENLVAGINNIKILKGTNLVVSPNKVTALMGPNGSGKSTLAHVLMGHPDYQVFDGKIRWQNKNILDLSVSQRAQLGIFLGFQYPVELPGVNLFEFLLTAHQSIHKTKDAQKQFDLNIQKALSILGLSEKFLERSANEGFSGGEKKKAEMLQLMVLQPRMIVLDEIDSGLDIDAMKLIAKTIRAMRAPDRGFLIITHYQRLLNYIKPDAVNVIINGRIVKSGSAALVKVLEKRGYDWLKHNAKQ